MPKVTRRASPRNGRGTPEFELPLFAAADARRIADLHPSIRTFARRWRVSEWHALALADAHNLALGMEFQNDR